VNQTQWPNWRGGAHVQDGSCDLAIPQEEGATIMSAAKVIMGVMARDCTEGIVGLEPLIKVTCRWHLFPIHVALAAPKDINIELCLEAWRSWTLGLLNG